MADQDFKIQVISEADNTGFKSASSAADELTQSTVKGGEAAEELGKAEEKGEEKAKLAAISHGDLQKVLQLIGHEAGPAAGAAMTSLTSILAGGGIGLAVLAIKQLFAALEEARQKAAETALEIANVWIAQRDAGEAVIGILDKIAEKQASNNAAFADEKRVLDALIEQRKKLLGEDDNAGDSARLDLAKNQLGRLQAKTPALDADVATLETEAGYARQSLPSLAGRDEAKLKAAVTEAEETLRKYREDGSVSFTSAQKAADALPGAKAALESYERDRETIQNFEKLKAELDRAIEARRANNQAIEDQTRAIQTDSRILGIHQQTEAISKAPQTLQNGTYQQIRELGDALGYSEQAKQGLTNAILNHVAGGDAYIRAAYARIKTLEDQMSSMPGQNR